MTDASSEMLYGFWYRAMPGSRVRRGGMETAMLLGIPLVVGRDNQGRAFAMRDSCPHRGIPLSFGWFDGEQLECCYHGWKFDCQTGQCREIPSLTPEDKLKPERIYAGHFPCQEQDGYIWVFIPDPDERLAPGEEPDTTPAPRMPIFSDNYLMTQLIADLPCTVDHGIIGLMDPAHGPFVHQSWWWRGRHSIHEKRKTFEPIDHGWRMSAHTPSANSAPYKLLRFYADADSITTTIDFILPNIRMETIRAGKYWFSSLTTVTPITAEQSRIDFCAAWNIFRHVPFVMPIFRAFGKRFIRQDQETMEKQALGLKYNPRLMLIDDADKPAKWYFQLKQAHLDAKRNGTEFKHPMDGPVTLRWRS